MRLNMYDRNRLAFEGKLEFIQLGYHVKVRSVTIGNLICPSGEIVAGDPSWVPLLNPKPFSRRVEPGCYPVDLAIAKFTSERITDEVIACARIRMSESLSHTLINADPAGYNIDSGTGSFMDAVAVATLRDMTESQRDRYWDQLRAARATMNRHGYSWASSEVDSGTGANVIVFTSGIGDGWGQCSYGCTAEGQLTEIVSDFGNLYSDEDLAAERRRKRWLWWKFW